MTGRILVLALAGLVSSGCIATSLRGISDQEHRVPEPRLFGEWRGVPAPQHGNPLDETYWEPSGEWNIQESPGLAFRATQRDGDEIVVHHGSVVRLGERLFLDLDQSGALACRVPPIIPCHTFASLDIFGDTLVVGYLRSDWLIEEARRGRLPRGVGLVRTEEDEALLTGGTPELQKLMVQAKRARGAFSIGKLVRVTSAR